MKDRLPTATSFCGTTGCERKPPDKTTAKAYDTGAGSIAGGVRHWRGAARKRREANGDVKPRTGRSDAKAQTTRSREAGAAT